MYKYGLFVLLYSRNQHNIVKQFSTNFKKKVQVGFNDTDEE